MPFATYNSRLIKNLCIAFVALTTIFSLHGEETNTIARAESPAARAQRIFQELRDQLATNTSPSELNWHFGQACFDWAEFAKDDSRRAEIAEQGIAACRAFIKQNQDSAPAHYFLGMNLGQLARTKWLGALSIVREMETEFKISRALNEKFDYAGPDRNLGLLYHEAPRLGSIGDQGKAKVFLQKAVELAPEYPENRLNLIEAYVDWHDRIAARRLLDVLENSLPQAEKEFSGPEWTSSWLDWRQRLTKLRAELGQPPKAVKSPREQNQ